MAVYVLEMRSTANWQDCRYREYTTSAKKAELFKDVPKIQFTDSGHAIVPHVREHSGHREPRNMLLADHVQDYIAAKGREVKPAPPPVGARSQHQQMRDAIDAVELALSGLEINSVVRLLEGADDSVMAKVPLGALRQLARCYPELNRIINDPAFERPSRRVGQAGSQS